jgi:hypothetical protein
MAFLLAALRRRFFLAGVDALAPDGSTSPRTFAQRRCCASRIRRNASGLNFRFPGVILAFAGPGLLPLRMDRSSAI